MDKRTVLGIFLIFLVLIVWSLMMSQKGQKKVESEKLIRPEAKQVEEEEKEAIKRPPISRDFGSASTSEQAIEEEGLDTVDTKLFRVVISRVGASIQSIRLKKYKGPEDNWVELIPSGERALFGVTGDTDLGSLVFNLVERTQSRLVYEAVGSVRKWYEFNDTSYIFDLGVGFFDDVPRGMERYKILWDSGLRSTEKHKEMEFRYFGGIVRLGGTTVFKSVGGLDTIPKGEPGRIDWVGAKNKYFLAAIVPLVETEEYKIRRGALGNVGGGCMRGCMPTGEVNPEALKVKVSLSTWSSDAHKFKIYVGPLDYDILRRAGHGLEDACYFGFKWIRPISRFFLKIFLALHRGIPNYGVVIIVFSLGLSLVFFPLTRTSHRSMAGMQRLQPKLQELQKKYKKEPKRLQQATMELYKKQGVNPFSGCLPLLIQMPIFFALYAILDTTIALRGAVFIPGWIEDLSQPDTPPFLPIPLLPILMGGMMFLQQKIQSKGMAGQAQQQQKMMMYMMPIMFTFIFLRFPSGLVLYWFVYNIFSFVQTSMIMSKFKREEKKNR